MAGDVSSAFRHCSIHSDSVQYFGGHIPSLNVLIIDLCAPFGWTASPGAYEVYGGAISFLHGTTVPVHGSAQCFSYHWVDEHVAVASDHHDAVARSLRAAMITVLGVYAINEEKFSAWSTDLKVLGLQFDTVARTVAMPHSKIAKARSLVAAAHRTTYLSVQAYRSLLGSLRHVATCVRPARAFMQRLRQHERGLQRLRQVPVSGAMRDDLMWWWIILHDTSLNGVPLRSFGPLPHPDIVVCMDASDFGLCALDIIHRRVLTHQFAGADAILPRSFKSGVRNGFDINYRELLSCAHATLHWSSQWHDIALRLGRQCHAQLRIDNTSAVAWQSRMHSHNPRALGFRV